MTLARVDDVVAALEEQNAELGALLDDLDDAGWQRASRCEAWTIKDVVLHVAQSNEMAVASAHDRWGETIGAFAGVVPPGSSIDDAVDAMVAAERSLPATTVRDRWRSSGQEFLATVKGGDPHRRVMWAVGQLSLHSLVTTRLAETWIHTGDVAFGLGVELPVAERLRHIARLAWRTLPYAFTRAGRSLQGPVAVELTGPAGAEWVFTPTDGDPSTVVHGEALEWCLVAARRLDPRDTKLRAEGPDADAVLELVRTWA